MAGTRSYIGNAPSSSFYTGTTKDNFVADGTQISFPLSVPRPGQSAADVRVVVENVAQQPVSTYNLIDTVEFVFASVSKSFTINELVNSGGAQGQVILTSGVNVTVEMASGNFVTGTTVTGASSGAVGTLSIISYMPKKAIKFTSSVSATSRIYVVGLNIPSLSALPPDASLNAAKFDATTTNLLNSTAKLTMSDMFSDFVSTGALTPTSANLVASISSGIVYVLGGRVVLPATSNTYQPNTDTYVDISAIGFITYLPVANNAIQPAQTPNTLRLQKVVTSASAITSVVRLAQLAVSVSNRNFAANTIITAGFTVATLPVGVIGMVAYVTDATAPSYLGVVSGGGTVTCRVFYNGTSWVS